MLDQPDLARQIMGVRSGGKGRFLWLAVTGAVALISIAAYPLLPRSYSSTATLLFHPVEQASNDQHPQSQQQEIDDNLISTQLDLLKARPLLTHVAEQSNLLSVREFNTTLRFNWRAWLAHNWPTLAQWWSGLGEQQFRDPNRIVVANLAKHLTVTRDLKSYLIQVTVWSADPAEAAKLANMLVSKYLEDEIARKRARQQQVLTALDNFIAAVQAGYQVAEALQHDFLMVSGLIHRGEKQAVQQQLNALSDAVAEAHKRAVSAESRAEELTALSKAGALDADPDILGSPMLQHLQERLTVLSSGAGAMTAPGGSINTIVAYLRNEITQQRQAIVSAAQTNAVSARKNEAKLRAEIDRLDAQLVHLADAERHANDLARPVDIASNMLRTAMTRRAEEAGRDMLLRPDAEVVAYAVAPFSPSFPTLLPYVAGTVALCLMILVLMLAPVISVTKRRDATLAELLHEH